MKPKGKLGLSHLNRPLELKHHSHIPEELGRFTDEFMPVLGWISGTQSNNEGGAQKMKSKPPRGWQQMTYHGRQAGCCSTARWPGTGTAMPLPGGTPCCTQTWPHRSG